MHEHGKHPNSLKNLSPIRDGDKAREMQKKSAESRKANRIVAKQLNKSIKDWNRMKAQIDMTNAPSALEFLRFRMLELMEQGKMMEAQELAKELVEFEVPKLSRVDQTNVNYDAGDLSDEELDAEITKLGVISGGRQ